MAKKVAYVVYAGFVPGVYTSWADTEKQVKGYGGRISHRGYTRAEGGYEQALIDLKAYVDNTPNPEEQCSETSRSSSKPFTLAKPAADAKENKSSIALLDGLSPRTILQIPKSALEIYSQQMALIQRGKRE